MPRRGYRRSVRQRRHGYGARVRNQPGRGTRVGAHRLRSGRGRGGRNLGPPPTSTLSQVKSQVRPSLDVRRDSRRRLHDGCQVIVSAGGRIVSSARSRSIDGLRQDFAACCTPPTMGAHFAKVGAFGQVAKRAANPAGRAKELCSGRRQSPRSQAAETDPSRANAGLRPNHGGRVFQGSAIL